MYLDVTVIQLDGLHKALLWVVLFLGFILFLIFKFGGKKSRARTVKAKRPSGKPRKSRRPPLKSKLNNTHPRNLTEIR